MNSFRLTLTVLQRGGRERQYVFIEPTRCVIGRATDCAIHLPQESGHTDVSRHHCLLEIDPPFATVRDLGSCNGTYVNGQRIGQRPAGWLPHEADLQLSTAHELRHGDEVRIGRTILRIAVSLQKTPVGVPARSESGWQNLNLDMGSSVSSLPATLPARPPQSTGGAHETVSPGGAGLALAEETL